MVKHSLRGFALLVALSAALPAGATTPTPQNWVGTWGASPAFPNGPDVGNTTIRQFIRTSLAGRRLRLRLTNEMGTAPLVIGAASVAMPGQAPGSIETTTSRALTFSGRKSVTLEPGMAMLSDPVEMSVAALQTLAVDLFVARSTDITATHPLGMATAWLAKAGDVTGQAALPAPKTSQARFFISRLEVDAPDATTLVAFGDSITDGYGSTPDSNRRWPDILAERLIQAHRPVSVVDAGISGNRVLHDRPEAEFGPSALARFDRDVLSVPNVRTVIFMESINDIGHPGSAGLSDQSVSADDIEAGMMQIIARAHEKNIRIIGATLTPYGDTVFPGYYDEKGEAKRETVNGWIRTSGQFDGVIDFDAVVRDPARPDHLRTIYDHGDHLHMNDAGYRKMAEAIDLDVLIPRGIAPQH